MAARDDGELVAREHAAGVTETDAASAASLRGFVPTPDAVVDLMVDRLFDGRRPTERSTVLDPGCGPGGFLDGIVRWCADHRTPMPQVVGVELDRARCAEAVRRFAHVPAVTIVNEDFLARSERRFDFVIGNPPYVAITGLSQGEREAYRAEYTTAVGRFDLYVLFFEQALRLLKPQGRMVFITPEKFLYVKSAEPLRRILAGMDVEEVRLVGEETFGSLVTYPTITTINRTAPRPTTRAVLRDGSLLALRWPRDGSSLLPLLNGHRETAPAETTLADVCVRVSCGVATGADKVYLRDAEALDAALAAFAYPTIAGRELKPGAARVETSHALLVPYDAEGALHPPEALGALGAYLEAQREALSARTCVRRKPWYAFHDNAPLTEVLRPKLLCKDIALEPAFWVDREGAVVPQHSVYYVVPKDPAKLDALAAYLNGAEARAWLKAHCQRAANGFLRVQSAVLKKLPVPASLGALTDAAVVEAPRDRAVRAVRAVVTQGARS